MGAPAKRAKARFRRRSHSPCPPPRRGRVRWRRGRRQLGRLGAARLLPSSEQACRCLTSGVAGVVRLGKRSSPGSAPTSWLLQNRQSRPRAGDDRFARRRACNHAGIDSSSLLWFCRGLRLMRRTGREESLRADVPTELLVTNRVSLIRAAVEEIRSAASGRSPGPGCERQGSVQSALSMSGHHGTLGFCVVDAGPCVLSPAYWAWTVQVPDGSCDPTGALSLSLKVPSPAVVAMSTVADPAGGW
jgi:hypothetical protein